MNNFAKLLLVAALLPHGCGSETQGDNGAPGPADAFVGVWQGSGFSEYYSAANGQYNQQIKGNATVSRLGSSTVSMDATPMNLSLLIFDIGADGAGHLRPNQGYDTGVLTLADEVLTLNVSSDVGSIMQPATYWVYVTLKRVP